jgi:hypothetical protein
MTTPFLSSWEKLKRAKLHIEELIGEGGILHRYVRQLEAEGKPLFTLDQEYVPRRHAIVVFVADVEPSDIQWGMTVGDILHNFRSALDHVAWRLVSEGKCPPENLTEGQQRRVQFPIYTDRKDFNDWLDKRLPGVNRFQRAVVRWHQPYRGGKRRALSVSIA